MKAPNPCIVLIAALLLGEGATAQKTTFRRYTGPIDPVHLDLESGVLTRGPVVNDRAVSTVSVFDNLDLGGFVGVDTGNCQCEWYDAGVMPSVAGTSSYVSGFVFAYCSSALDPISGGPGGTAQIFFNQGYVNRHPRPNNPGVSTDVARITVTGLPANTGNSSFFGGFRCYFVTISLGQTFCLPDGNIGYGWKRTFSLTYHWPPTISSMSIDIREAFSTGTYPSAIFAQPSTVPSITLTDNAGSISFGPNLGDPGEPYGVLLNCTPASVSGLYRIDLRPDVIPGGVPTGFQGTLLYAAGPLLAKFTGVHTMSAVTTPIVTLPKDLTFACLPYTNQGWCQDTPKGFLSSALRETIGIP